MSEHKKPGLELSLDEYQDWKEKNPVIVPDRIKDELEHFNREFARADLLFGDFNKLSQAHFERMQGQADDDLLFQLAVVRNVSGSGTKIKEMLLEDKLRACYCGSGLRYAKCHGA